MEFVYLCVLIEIKIVEYGDFDVEGKMCVVVCFIVFDNGFGFLVCILICVFEFYVMIKVKGMGFGLVMVKKIVDEYGVWIDLCNCMYGEIVEGV